MRKNKICALSMATILAVNSTVAAWAEDVLDCSGWWVAHTEGYEVDEEGLRITFDSTTYESAEYNWNTPIVVVYTGDEAVVNGEGYSEYAVIRSDLWAWAPDNINGVSGIVNLEYPDNWTAAGYTFECLSFYENFDWESWLNDNKAGVTCTVDAQKLGDTVVVEFSNNEMVSRTTIPVDGDKEVYISLTGEYCKISNICVENLQDVTESEQTSTDAVEEETTTPGSDDETTEPEEETTVPGVEDEEITTPDDNDDETTSTEVVEYINPLPNPGTYDVVIGDAFTANTGYEVVSGDFDVTYTFHNDGNGSDNWENFILELRTLDCVGQLGNSKYPVYIDARADCYGWVVNTSSECVMYWEELTEDIDWEEYAADMAAGMDCEVNVTRTGNTFTFNIAEGEKYYFKGTVEVPEFEGLDTYMYLTGDNVELSNVVFTVNYEEGKEAPEDGVLDSNGWWKAVSEGYAVDEEGLHLEFDSVTYSGAGSNWDTPSVIVYTGDEPVVQGEGYQEYALIRSDGFAWAPTNINGVSGLVNVGIPENWAAAGYSLDIIENNMTSWEDWLLQNKAGVKCTVDAWKVGNVVVVDFSNNGFTTRTVIPASADEVYISLTGELCTMSDIVATAAVKDAPNVNGTNDGTIDCTGWWMAHSGGYAVDEDGLKLTFDSETYSTATSVWNIPVYVIYSGDEPIVNGANYQEYAVVRSDLYGWSGEINTAQSEEFAALGYTWEVVENWTTCDADWEQWLEDNRNGVSCVLNAWRDGDKVVAEFTNDGLTSRITVPVDSDKEVYISLTGEYCVLSNIVEGTYEDTDVPEEETTVTPEEDTTVAPEEETTTAPEETTTVAPEEETTTAPEETTTVAPEEEATTAPEETTTAAPEEETTTAPEEDTTAAPEEETTTAPEETTTVAPEEETTTAPEEETTTKAPVVVKVPEMSQEEIKKVEKEAVVEGLKDAGFEEEVNLVFEIIPEASDIITEIVKLVEEKFAEKGEVAIVAVDISLQKTSGGKVEKQPDGYLRITIPVFEHLKGAKDVEVFRVEDDGTMTSLGVSKVHEDKVSFKTNHFSTYVFVDVTEKNSEIETTTENTTQAQQTTPQTGDSAPVAGVIAVAVSSIVVVFGTRRKRSVR